MPAATLIADDNKYVRSALRSFLEGHPAFRVCGEAIDGLDAIEQAEKLKPDLILLDLAMPRMTGVEAARVLRRMLPRARIVLVSAYADSVGQSLASLIGVDRVISKSNAVSELANVLETLLVS